MSWHCSAEAEAGFSLPDYLAGLRSVPSNVKNTEGAPSFSASVTECSTSSPSGTMSTLLMERHGGGLWTSSPEGSPAKTFRVQEREPVLPEAVRDYSSRCAVSLKKLNLALSSPKTARICVPVDLAPSSDNLPRWGMTVDGVCWELGTSARLTSATGCGYLPTLKASAAGPDLAKMKRSSTGISLQTALVLLPDPGQGPKLLAEAKRIYLETGFYAGKDRGQMTPEFGDWIMGFPIGWSASAPLAMHRFRSWLLLHGKFCRMGLCESIQSSF